MYKPKPLFAWFAETVTHHARCHNGNFNEKWAWITERRIAEAIANVFPSGSGFDSGTRFVIADHFDEKGNVKPWLKFVVEFHHMHESGMYDGWTAHTVTVKPSLAYGFDLSVSGPNRNDIKDYIAETFNALLRDEVTEYAPEDVPSDKWEFRINGRRLASADYKG